MGLSTEEGQGHGTVEGQGHGTEEGQGHGTVEGLQRRDFPGLIFTAHLRFPESSLESTLEFPSPRARLETALVLSPPFPALPKAQKALCSRGVRAPMFVGLINEMNFLCVMLSGLCNSVDLCNLCRSKEIPEILLFRFI